MSCSSISVSISFSLSNDWMLQVSSGVGDRESTSMGQNGHHCPCQIEHVVFDEDEQTFVSEDPYGLQWQALLD